MGRGLSSLQCWILQEAATRKRLYAAEICRGFFGWQPCRPMSPWMSPSSPQFAPQQIGAGEYRRVKATISRSCRRLWQRGLIKRRYSPVEITAKGRDWLSVNFLTG